MGCIWSEVNNEANDRCDYCNRRAVNNLTLIDNVCEICIGQFSRLPTTTFQLKARFGEYHCSCGRFWTSRLSWARSYQICMSCKNPVYAQNQRDLRPSDLNFKENVQEHPKKYCQMCQQLGSYCGNFGKKGSRNNPNKRRLEPAGGDNVYLI